MLLFRVKVDLRVIAMKEYSPLSNNPGLELRHVIVLYNIQDTCWGVRAYAFAEM